MRKFMRNNFSAFILVLILAMSFVPSAHAADIMLSSAVLINSSNKSQYEGKSVAGTIPDSSSAGEYGFFISPGAIVIDGIELNLTIDGLNMDYSGLYSMRSGISLMNGARLHLAVNGGNNLKAGYGGTGITIPAECTLEITATSLGTGLRSLLDAYVFMRKYYENLDFNYVRREAEKLGIAEFEEQNCSIALRLFVGYPLTEENREMLEYIRQARNVLCSICFDSILPNVRIFS